MKKIYLAGFDVFRPDAVEHGEYLKRLCEKVGFTGLYPLDNCAPPHLTGKALAQWICDANLQLIREANIVMANLNAFRGHEPDSGTVFEVGYGVALGHAVWAYTDEIRSLVAQVGSHEEQEAGRRRIVDDQGFTVEDFGLSLNLMIACTANVVQGDAQTCLAQIAASADAG
ncbi:nucleoside 2-deoxyribosyltransferase [Allopusillimonas ginsengisoli]|uniref:nucleoside 2-deoxyribosyltransferase n=1 Tax=Allopusillimonas ginsengisoli TaxID=453575 RepID=UPI0010C177B3|nr:nucleoside 2-deoxyribosyltransferase [Allopusillimonas ginsengisoli]